MSNSSLVAYTKLSPNHSGKRTCKISRITPHCFVGQVTLERIGTAFESTSRQASCNYGISKDGKVALIVDEGNRSWCTSSNYNDQRAVTIECASDTSAPYAMNDAVYKCLVNLCVDICKRNGKKKLLHLGSKDKALNYEPKSDEMVLTAHRWYANKSCPGDWLYSRYGQLAKEVTEKLSAGSTTVSTTASTTASKPATTTSAYYPKYTGTSSGIDAVLRAIGVPDKFVGSWAKRKPVAVKNGITNYTGTAAQNIKLRSLAKEGKLKKV